MKVLTNIIFFVIFLMGCSRSVYFKYDIVLNSANDNLINNEENVYSDEELTISFDYYRGFIRVNITNNSDSVIFLMWNKSSFLNLVGETDTIIRNNSRIIDGFNPSEVSTIFPGKKITDYITTSDKYFWTDGYYNGQKYIEGTWNSIGIFPYKTTTTSSYSDEKNEYYLKLKKYYAEKEFKILFTLEKNNNKNLEYIFNLKIKDVGIDYNMGMNNG